MSDMINREEKIISVVMVNNSVFTYNVMSKGNVGNYEIILGIKIHDIKYFILIDNQKIFLKLNKNGEVIEPTPEQFKTIESEI